MGRNLIMFSKFDKITLANWWLSQQNIIWIHQVDQTVTLFLLFKPRATDIFFLVFNVVFSYQSNNQRDVKLLTTGNNCSRKMDFKGNFIISNCTKNEVFHYRFLQ